MCQGNTAETGCNFALIYNSFDDAIIRLLNQCIL
jgi:hypothetical protein